MICSHHSSENCCHLLYCTSTDQVMQLVWQTSSTNYLPRSIGKQLLEGFPCLAQQLCLPIIQSLLDQRWRHGLATLASIEQIRNWVHDLVIVASVEQIRDWIHNLFIVASVGQMRVGSIGVVSEMITWGLFFTSYLTYHSFSPTPLDQVGIVRQLNQLVLVTALRWMMHEQSLRASDRIFRWDDHSRQIDKLPHRYIPQPRDKNMTIMRGLDMQSTQ